MTNTRVNNVTTPSREFRLNHLSLSRLNWLQSYFNSHDWRPSGSVVVRRALSFYLDHIESLMTEEDDSFQSELVKIKAHRNNEKSPFGERRGFDGRPFSEMLKQARTANMADKFSRYGYQFPKEGMPPEDAAVWDQIWDKVERGEKP